MKVLGLKNLLGWTLAVSFLVPTPALSQSVDVVGNVSSARAARHSTRPTSGGAYAAVRPNQVVRNGDGLRTDRRGFAQVAFNDKSVLRLNELTELIVQDSMTLRRLQLAKGALWLRVTKGSNTSVQTPVATATVRGTELLFDAEGNLAVREGTVELEANGFTIEVHAGEIAGVDKDGRPFKKGWRIPTDYQIDVLNMMIPAGWWELIRSDPAIVPESRSDRGLETAALVAFPLLLLIDTGGNSSSGREAVPEPATLAGILVGALALKVCRRKK